MIEHLATKKDSITQRDPGLTWFEQAAQRHSITIVRRIVMNRIPD